MPAEVMADSYQLSLTLGHEATFLRIDTGHLSGFSYGFQFFRKALMKP